MSKKLAVGLMRLNPRGVITPCDYDFSTRQIGYIRVTLPIAFTEEYVPSVCVWSRHDLWKAIVSSDEVVAVLLVNNSFLLTVSEAAIVIYSKDAPESPQIAKADTHFLFKPTRPIGFVRTCPEIRDVNIPPYQLFMDDNNRVSLKLGEFKTVSDAIVSTSMLLYKTLITTNRTAIYQTNDGQKFI